MTTWNDAIDRMLRRIDDTAARVGDRFPHWADPETGAWTTTPDGDWTGGYWIGMLWLAATATGQARYRAAAGPPPSDSATDPGADRVQVVPALLRCCARRDPARRRRPPGDRARDRAKLGAPLLARAPARAARRPGRGGLARGRYRDQHRQPASRPVSLLGRGGDRRRHAARHRVPPCRDGDPPAPPRRRLVHPVELARSRHRPARPALHAQGAQRHEHVGPGAGVGHAVLDAEPSRGPDAPVVARGRDARGRLVARPRPRRPRGVLGLRRPRRSRTPSATPRRRPSRWRHC